MSNSWFRFKQFMIRQDKTAMKVGTDGVLLGAWAPVTGCVNILDVGTGTGLIALMIAQRCDARIDAIEIDADAARQAATNISESLWADRIMVTCTTFRDFCKSASDKYDLIACNPPFFSNSLKAKNPSRNLARHNDELSLQELVSGSGNLLNANGHLCVILPADVESEMMRLTEKVNLFPVNILRIRPLPGKDYKRVLMDYSFSKGELSESEMSVESGTRHQYSMDYIELTRNFYLKP